MVVFEYRVVLPYTLAEFSRGFEYACERQRAEVMASSANGETADREITTTFDGVPDVVLSHGRVPRRELLCQRGTFMRNKLNLGTRFPGWVRAILPKEALIIREEYWSAFPYTFCRYSSELFPKCLDYTIESMHYGSDCGARSDVFGCMTDAEATLMALGEQIK